MTMHALQGRVSVQVTYKNHGYAPEEDKDDCDPHGDAKRPNDEYPFIKQQNRYFHRRQNNLDKTGCNDETLPLSGHTFRSSDTCYMVGHLQQPHMRHQSSHPPCSN